ncbi:hypothetical protein FOA52_002351 [Chlamydomonas sp. UWO 241]|nr:hypothetical protein FOA52_002351 [Chlamydomonas sp. UWO 241]
MRRCWQPAMTTLFAQAPLEVKGYLNGRGITHDLIDLTDDNAASRFNFTTPLRPGDPQQRLQLGRDYDRVMGSDFAGFVGYAVNLIYLPKHLLDLK